MDLVTQVRYKKSTTMGCTELLRELKVVSNNPYRPDKVRLKAYTLRKRLKYWIKLPSSRDRYPTHIARQAAALINRPVYVTLVIKHDFTKPTASGVVYTKESLEKVFAKVTQVPILRFREPRGETIQEKIKDFVTVRLEDVVGFAHSPRIEGNKVVVSASRQVVERVSEYARYGFRAFGLKNADTPDEMVDLVAIDCFKEGQ